MEQHPPAIDNRRPVNERLAAEYLGVARQTLANWRFQHEGPPYLKLGKTVRYLYSDLDAWLKASRVDPSAQ